MTTFSLPAGHTCPYAKDCQSRSDRETGKITDGVSTVFRCYAASMECRRPSVRESRWHNLELLRSCRNSNEMTALILNSLSPLAGYVRIHDSGDFFNQQYFDAWVAVATERSQTTFYAYTKALPFWVKRLALVGTGRKAGAVKNFVLTASLDGKKDTLIAQHGLRSARVVYSECEAKSLRLHIDHDDSHAMKHGKDFALLIHGVQPAQSAAGAAVSVLRQNGWSGYRESGRRALPVLSA